MKFINAFVRLFQSRARNQALAKSTEMFRVSTVWVLKPAIMLKKAFFSFWYLYSGQGRTAWSQVTVTHAPYFSGTEVVKFLIDMCNTWRYLLLLLLIINRPWRVHSFEWKLPTQEKRTFAKHWKQICQTSSSEKSKVSWATPLSRLYVSLAVLPGKVFGHSCTDPCFSDKILDCKTVRIFAYSSTREQSSKRSGARLKKASETEQWREGVWLLLRYTKPILRKKPTILTV